MTLLSLFAHRLQATWTLLLRFLLSLNARQSDNHLRNLPWTYSGFTRLHGLLAPCPVQNNSADIFGNDVYMESWVATVAYFNPYPPTADVYTNPLNIQPIADMPPVSAPCMPEINSKPYDLSAGCRPYAACCTMSDGLVRLPPTVSQSHCCFSPVAQMYYPASVVSPPPSPPAPPSPPPPAPPAPPDPSQYIYTEDQLWDALNNGNTTITLAAHIQFEQQGKWALGPPPPVISEVHLVSMCEGYGQTCIIDMAGSRFPLLNVQSGAIIKAYNVRIMNGATMGDGAAVQLSAPMTALFDTCDFVGNYANNGGAVTIKAALDVTFQNCNFNLNWADANGGAVYSLSSTVFFKGSSFYLNRAKNGGAIALGPASTAFILDANFTRNYASQWGPDVFVATPVGSTLYLNQWPPETVAQIFPTQSTTKWYFAPPPVPPSPPSPPPSFKRAPYPPPGPLPPQRVNSPPPR